MYALAIAATLLASTGLAAPAKRAEHAPFGMVANGGPYASSPISACHAGAAIEALCIYGGGEQFTFNNVGDNTPVKAGQSAPGNLIFTLGSSTPDAESLVWYKNETSNVHAGFFGNGQDGPVTLAISDSPRTLGVVVGSDVQDSWFVCPVTYSEYHYDTVSWVPAGETPDNADCQAVSIALV